MIVTDTSRALLAAFILASGAGCKKSGSDAPSVPPAATALSPDTVARVHWLGKKRLGGEATAFYFMRIWDLPDSLQLEGQTLDKLSPAPWRLLHGEPAVASAPSALVRPLLDNVVQEECYLEVREATNQLVEFVFAINLDDRRAGEWRTNLVVVLASLTGITTMDVVDGGRGWLLKKPPNVFELTRVGGWTVVGLAQETNTLLGEIVARIKRDHTPYVSSGTNLWLEADLDLSRAPQAFPLNSTLSSVLGIPISDLPRLSVRVTGDGGNVVTTGELNFTKPLKLEFDTWRIPTNLIREPLTSFTALRGLKPWLVSWKIWNDLQIGPPPNQVYFWSLDGAPMQTYFAIPLPDASDRVRTLTQVLLRDGNPWLASRSVGSFVRLPDSNGATWGGLPLGSPFIKFADEAVGGVVFGGLLPSAVSETTPPPPAEMIQDVLNRTNLVYYDWEATGSRIEAWLNITQVARVASRHAQLPLELASLAWLRAISIRLDKSATVVTRTGTNQLSFVRKSTAGLTAPELHLIADWLESPQFPRGLYSLLGPPNMTQ